MKFFQKIVKQPAEAPNLHKNVNLNKYEKRERKLAKILDLGRYLWFYYKSEIRFSITGVNFFYLCIYIRQKKFSL